MVLATALPSHGACLLRGGDRDKRQEMRQRSAAQAGVGDMRRGPPEQRPGAKW
jgi:hypothetical protein